MAQRIDLRSDTVTMPTAAMLQAMVAAPLGDDVLGDDPTVNALETRCAALSGKDAALFVPSGTMANLIAIEISTQRGDEVLLHEQAHPFHYESGGAAGLAGVQLRRLPGDRGVMEVDTVRSAVRAPYPHYPRTSLLCVEDTHNGGGGTVQPLENTDALCTAAKELGLATHLDGARLFNASVASATTVARRARDFDTVSFCFSKGLGCPAGSVLCGDTDRMQRARRMRKMLGGAMRQTGLLAGAALYALDHHVDRLAEDHQRSAAIAAGLTDLAFRVEPPQTNIAIVEVGDATAFVNGLEAEGVRCYPVSATHIRLVVHLGITDADVGPVIRAFAATRSRS